MRHPNAPLSIRAWAESTPDWVVSGSASNKDVILGLGAGENAAINIALEVGAEAILIDDRRGIREATSRGLNSLTTFALLEQASKTGLIDFAESITALTATSFRMPPQPIVSAFLERNRSR
jgi:predicted nucleic acid-binding protein